MKICLTCEGVLDRDDTTCAHCGGPLLDARSVLVPQRRGDDEAHGPLVGRVVDGKYRVVGVLGRGGMGIVYRAVHEVSLIPVALKVLHPRWSARPDFRGWFLAEARKAGRVLHEGSARVLDVGAAIDGTVYLAVELVDGQTLAEWLGANPHADLAVIVDLCEQIARAMVAAHAAGVVHRDLTPRNIMIAQRADRLVTKVLDFGIAIGAPPSMRADASESMVDLAPAGFANPPYSAPEHLAGRDVDARADLYSLGVILYEALSGQLPVDGSTARELARETIEGRIRPFRPRRPIPRALARLVTDLTRLDPQRRPRSALEVADRLHDIRQPRRRVLASFAVVGFLLAAAALLLAYTPGRRVAFLRARANPAWLATFTDPPQAAQALRTANLLATRFDYGGFSPDGLAVRVGREGRVLFVASVADALVSDGDVLRFSAAVALAARVREACIDGPVDLAFVIRELEPIAFARVLVDDSAPIASLEIVPELAPAPALRGDDLLVIDFSDHGGIARAWVEVELLRVGAARREHEEVELEAGPTRVTARALLGARFGEVRSWGACELRVGVVDRAGNEARSLPRTFAELDLGTPAIVEVGAPGGGGLLIHEGGVASLRVRLDAAEPGIELWARRPGAQSSGPGAQSSGPGAQSSGPGAQGWAVVAASVVGVDAGDRLDAGLRGEDSGEPAPSGRWSFQIRDPAGNHSEVFEEDLVIRTADPRPELRPIARRVGDGIGIVEFAGGFVADGGPWRLGLRVEPLYRPRRCVAKRADGESVEARLETVEPGSAVIVVDRIESGVWQLEAEVVDPRNDSVVSLPPRELRVLGEPIELHVPETAGASFLPELIDRSVFELRDGAVAQGAGWQLQPADTRLVRGRIWTRVGGSMVARDLRADGSPSQPILAPVSIGRGWHEILFDLEDVLGRPLRVSVGAGPAPREQAADGRMLTRIARFYAHDAPVQFTQATAAFEFGEALRLGFTVELPAADEYPWRLAVGNTPVAPSRVEASGVLRMLSFAVPFDVAAAAADLAGLDAAAFALGQDGRIGVRISTPAGPFDLTVPVRTIRTTLRVARLADLRDGLPEPIGAIRLVPVPGPGVGGVFREPVPAGWPGRVRFRTSAPVDVRNVPDVYVQDRELTRAQYFATVDAGLSLAAGLDVAARRALVATDDPLGLERLTRAALMPRGESDPASGRRVTAPDAPICGVDFYQAEAVTRLLGLLFGEDLELFRLPLGVELELAALGAAPLGEVALNGSAARGPGVEARSLRAPAAGEPAAAWPPTAERAVASGDYVVTDLGDLVSGLDAGVREWVLDLPFRAEDPRGRAVLEELRADHARHLQRARGGGAGEGARDRAGPTRGVLRGIASGAAGSVLENDAGRATRTWPGVVRELQIRRDGKGLLPGSADPHLARAGFRLVGGARFIAEVRAR